jgi:hypothetical protein
MRMFTVRVYVYRHDLIGVCGLPCDDRCGG